MEFLLNTQQNAAKVLSFSYFGNTLTLTIDSQSNISVVTMHVNSVALPVTKTGLHFTAEIILKPDMAIEIYAYNSSYEMLCSGWWQFANN